MIDEADAASIARQITGGFGLGAPRSLVPVVQGAMGRVWRLDTASEARHTSEHASELLEHPLDVDMVHRLLDVIGTPCDAAGRLPVATRPRPHASKPLAISTAGWR